MYQILKKTGSNQVLAKQNYSLDFHKPFIFFREVLTLTEKCSSPNKTHLKKNCKTKLESGVYGNERSDSFSVAVTPLTTNREAVSGASSPKGCELAHVGFVPEHAVK
jgi:hypothetical protein